MESQRVPFNFKLIVYPNGTAQLRHYDTYLTGKEIISDYEELPFQFMSDDYLNPFTLLPVSDIGESFEKEVKVSTEDSKMRSYSRTKQAIYEYSRSCHWEWFVTFTASLEKIDRYDYDLCSKKIRKWLNNQRKLYAPNLKYLVVPEQHKDGAWHFHGLFSDVGNMAFIDSGVKKKGRNIYNLPAWSIGFTEATKVGDSLRAGHYIAKYVNKSLCDFVKGRQRYYVSQNLSKPMTYVFCLGNEFDVDNVADLVADSLGKKIAHVSRTRAEKVYTKVDYFEMV